MTESAPLETPDSAISRETEDIELLRKELRVLKNRLIAQRWDIEGLTEQRDAALAAYSVLSAEVEQLRLEVVETGARDHLVRVREGAVRSQAVFQRTQTTALGLVGSPAFPALLADRANASAVAEALAIVLSGLFDLDWYQQVSKHQFSDSLEAVLHYLREGDRRGFSPHRLFQPDYYSLQLERASVSRKSPYRSRLGHYLKLGATRGVSPCLMFDIPFYRAQIGKTGENNLEPIFHYLTIGSLAGLSPHPLFDAAYYGSLWGHELSEDPLVHFMTLGAQTHLATHRLFDSGYYRGRYPDVAESGLNPMLHYVLFGDAEGYQPNPVFDVKLYRTLYGEEIAPQSTALAHYVTHWEKEGGLRTHALFDGAFYRRRYLDLAAINQDPLQHFLDHGSRERRSPHPLFNTEYLLAQIPQLAELQVNPITAYLGTELRFSITPSPAFDIAHYCAQAPEARDWPEGPLLHYLHVGADSGLSPHPLFDPQHYTTELTRAGMTVRPGDLLTHFFSLGYQIELSPHPLFDCHFYTRMQRDVGQSGVNPWEHFLLFGGTIGERRQPHILFDIQYYAKRYGGGIPAGKNLLLDYLAAPPEESRVPHPLFDPVHYLAQRADDLRYANPLVDYVSKGSAARRAPHRLFAPDFYCAKVKLPAGWHRTYLEHYCEYPEAAQLLPHPLMDTDYFLACKPQLAGGTVNFLRYYLENGVIEGLDPHPAFDAVSYRLSHPEIEETGEDPFVHYLRLGGKPNWSEHSPSAGRRAKSGRRAPARRGDSAFTRIKPSAAADMPDLKRLLEEVPVRWRQNTTARRKRRAAFFVIVATREEALDSKSLRALIDPLAAHKYDIAVVAETQGEPPKSALSEIPWLLARPPGGGAVASWTLGLSVFRRESLAYEKILLIDDRLVGPLGSTDRLWANIRASSGVWQPYALSTSMRHTLPPMIAVSAATLGTEPFREYLSDFCYTDAAVPQAIPANATAFSNVLLRAAGRIDTLIDVAKLREHWVRGIAERLDWFAALAERRAHRGFARFLSREIAVDLARYAEDWYRFAMSIILTGEEFDPGLLFAESMATERRFPFLRRDLLLQNPLKTPEILRLPTLLSAPRWESLKRLLADDLPPFHEETPSFLRLTRAHFGLAPTR